MSAPIQGLGALQPVAVPAARSTTAAGGPDFGAALGDAIDAAGKAEKTADEAGVRFANGDPSLAIDQVMIAAEKAAITLRYAVSLKNKAIEAYRELMNTPI